MDGNKALRLFGELQGFLFGGVLLLFVKGGLDCFFAEHCAGGFGFVWRPCFLLMRKVCYCDI